MGGCEEHPCLYEEHGGRGSACSYVNYSLWCEPCSNGLVGLEHNGNKGSITCSLCSPGQGSNANSTACVGCGPKQFSASGNCQPCEAPNVVNADKTTCAACKPGEEPNIERTQCIPCKPGTASAFGIQCDRCDAPRVVDEQRTTCQACEAGKGPNHNHTGCQTCADTTYSSFGTPCQDCPAGSTNNSLQSACEDINECETNSGGCDPIARCDGEGSLCTNGCTNLDPSYRCGPCPAGFIRTEILDNATGVLAGSRCALPPPPPAGSGTAAVQPKMSMQIAASTAVLVEGSAEREQLIEALKKDLAQSLGIKPSDIVISGIREDTSETDQQRRRLAQPVSVAFDFVVTAGSSDVQSALETLKQDLVSESSPLMSGALAQLGYNVTSQADDLTVAFVCPSGKIRSSSGCESCPQTPKAQYTDDSVQCQQCPSNQQVNDVGDGCVCADNYYDAHHGPLVCYGPEESFDTDDFAPAAAQDSPDNHCQPCSGQLDECVSCNNGVPAIKAGISTSEAAKAGATGPMPSRGIVGPLALFVCPSDGCLGQTSAQNATSDGEWLSPCERGYIGALCSACDSDADFIGDGTACTECKSAADTAHFVWLLVVVAAATIVYCAAAKFKDHAKDHARTSVVVTGSVVLSVVQLKILIGVFQITADLPSVLMLDYPDVFDDCIAIARVLLVDIFNIFKIDCISPLSLHAKFIVVMLLPPIGIGALQLVRLWSDSRAGKDDATPELVAKRKAANSTTAAYRSSFITVVLYPLLTRTCFRMYDCHYLSEDEGWHPEEFTIACDVSNTCHIRSLCTVSDIRCSLPAGPHARRLHCAGVGRRRCLPNRHSNRVPDHAQA